MPEELKRCPLFAMTPHMLNENCLKEQCAWWCKWTECCAMVAIPSVLTNN